LVNLQVASDLYCRNIIVPHSEKWLKIRQNRSKSPKPTKNSVNFKKRYVFEKTKNGHSVDEAVQRHQA
jgi:L-serine deaminase